MKILYILRSEFGSIGTNASYMIPSIVDKIHTVRVISFKPSEIKKSMKVYSATHLDIREFPDANISKKAAIILDQIDEFDPDIIHQFYHGDCQKISMMGRARETRNRAWFLDIRSPLFGDSKGIRKEKWKNLFYQQNYDAIFTHDPSSPKTVFPLIYKPIILAPLSINSQLLERGLSIRPLEGVKCVFIGSIAKSRKLDLLIDGVQAVKKLNIDIKLDIYGDGNDLQRLKRSASTKGLDNTITFNGLMEQNVLMEKIKSYQLGICYVPSKNFSNSPALKFYEYCAAGLYPICSKNPGLQQFEEQGFKAQFFSNTPSDFADAIANLPAIDVVNKTRKVNFERLQNHTWENVVKKSILPTYMKYALDS